MAVEVPASQARGYSGRLGASVPGGVPVTHGVFVVQEIDRELHEDGTRHAAPGDGKRPLDLRDQLPQAADRHSPLHVWLEQRQLIDVLERTSPLEDGRGCAPQYDDRGLCELGVFHGCDGVGDARPGGHRRDARCTR